MGRRERMWVCMVSCLLVWAWTMAVGKDVSWDLINHHLYLPFSLLTGRFRTDLFAAGPQSYQNPVGYLPAYLLIRAGLAPVLVGTALAVAHGLIAWPVHQIATRLWPIDTSPRFWRIAAVAAALLAPVFLLTAGTSSSDPWGAMAVLVSLALLLNPHGGIRGCVWSGLWMGLAIGIKPSSAIFALALGLVGALQWASGMRRFRDAGAWCVGVLLSFGLVAGPWCLWLYQAFGNPLFPLFNQIFHSPYAPLEAMTTVRFLPQQAWDYVSRWWQLAEMRAYVATEQFTPDIRPLVAGLCGTGIAILGLTRSGALGRIGRREFWRGPEVQLTVFLLSSYVLWMLTSGNARYVVAWFVLLGVMMVRWLQRLLPLAAARVVLGLVLALQSLYYGGDGTHRTYEAPWSESKYFDTEVPAQLRDQPWLHLSLDVQTHAALALDFHPAGAFINLIGQMTLPTGGPLNDLLQQRLDSWRDRARILVQSVKNPLAPADAARVHQYQDRLIERYGLAVDWSDCLTVYTPSTPLVSCRVVRRMAAVPTLDPDEARVEQAFVRLEQTCPRLLSPRPLATDRGPRTWNRHYINSDSWVRISLADGVTMGLFRSLRTVRLGSIDDVLAGRSPNPCELPLADQEPE